MGKFIRTFMICGTAFGCVVAACVAVAMVVGEWAEQKAADRVAQYGSTPTNHDNVSQIRPH